MFRQLQEEFHKRDFIFNIIMIGGNNNLGVKVADTRDNNEEIAKPYDN